MITGGRGWEKEGLENKGAGSFESRPSKREEEVKTGKRAMTVESGRPPLGAISERRAYKKKEDKRNRPAIWRAGSRKILRGGISGIPP